MKDITRLVAVGAFAVAFSITGAGLTASKSEAAIIDLGFAFDGSGSVSTANFNTAKAALSQALSVIPTSGANVYRITVVQFSSSGLTSTVTSQVINSGAALTTVQNAVAAMGYQNGGSTCISCATQLLTNNVINTFGGFGDLSLINIMTDGVANGGNSNGATLRTATIGAGWDAISAEAVGSFNTSFLLALTGAAATISDTDDLPSDPMVGFVLALANFDAYAAAIDLKVQNIVDTVDPGQTPIPGALPLFASGLGALGFLTWRRKKTAQKAA